jgi:hypothetical protein
MSEKREKFIRLIAGWFGEGTETRKMLVECADDMAALLAEIEQMRRWAAEHNLLGPDGNPRKILGTLPLTGDGCICGLPPGFGTLFGKGRNCKMDRYDPVSMRYDPQTRSAVLVVYGVHGGVEWDAIPIGSLYSTVEAFESRNHREQEPTQ